MPIRCVSPLAANPQAIPIPGGTELRFDVQVAGLTSFEVVYTILTNTDLVRFASGRTDEVVRFAVDGAQMTLVHHPSFVCTQPNQQPSGFVSFTIEARAQVRGVTECTPIGHPTIRVTAWNCAAEGAPALEGTTIRLV